MQGAKQSDPPARQFRVVFISELQARPYPDGLSVGARGLIGGAVNAVANTSQQYASSGTVDSYKTFGAFVTGTAFTTYGSWLGGVPGTGYVGSDFVSSMTGFGVDFSWQNYDLLWKKL